MTTQDSIDTVSDTSVAPAAEDAPKNFADLGVEPQICAALADIGITTPFPIQELTLPLALSGADLIGQARTGTGKTLAFGIPLLSRVDLDKQATQALVIVPTRELCLQVAGDLEQAGKRQGVRVVAVYGGKALDPQMEAIAAGSPVVVGTPGRLLDLVRRGALNLSTVKGLVLDEADEMLDLGFLPDVEQLIEATHESRQTLLFSATMPSAVVALARRYMHKPTFLRADVEEIRIGPETKQHFFSCHRMDKPSVLARILQSPERGLCVVFTRTKRMADVLVEELRERGVPAAPIHSDLRQEAREKALERFRKGTIDVLCATEVAARGLDIDDVTHVINYDCPDDEKMYLHRIGRTGRAGAAGIAVTLAVWNELARLEMIKKALDIDEPTHEVFSTSPILDDLFDLPERKPKTYAKPPGKAPRDKRSDRSDRPDRSGGGRAPSRRPAPEKSSGKPSGKPSGKSRASDRPSQDRRAAAAEAAPEPATRSAPEQQAPSEPGTSGGKRVRARRRTRVGPDEAAQPRTRRPDTEARGEAVPQAAPVPRETPPEAAPSDDNAAKVTRTRTRSRSRGGEGGPQRSSKPATGEPRRRSGASTGENGSESRAKDPDRSDGRSEDRSRDRGRSGRTGRGRQSSRSKGSSRPERVDAATARGDGQPALRRPLRIEHLP